MVRKQHTERAERFIENLDSDEICFGCPEIYNRGNGELECPCEWDWFDSRCINWDIVERVMDLIDEVDEELKSHIEMQTENKEMYRHELP